MGDDRASYLPVASVGHGVTPNADGTATCKFHIEWNENSATRIPLTMLKPATQGIPRYRYAPPRGKPLGGFALPGGRRATTFDSGRKAAAPVGRWLGFRESGELLAAAGFVRLRATGVGTRLTRRMPVPCARRRRLTCTRATTCPPSKPVARPAVARVTYRPRPERPPRHVIRRRRSGSPLVLRRRPMETCPFCFAEIPADELPHPRCAEGFDPC